jgi:hypothetical protein
MNEQARRSTPAESSSLSYGPTIRLGLLSTSLHSDAVTSGYGVVAYSDTDFHRADVAPSRAHSFPRKRNPVTVDFPGFRVALSSRKRG